MFATVFFESNWEKKLQLIQINLLNKRIKIRENAMLLRQNKKTKCVSVTHLKILGSVGHAIYFFWKKYNLMHFEMPFKMHKIIFFQKTEKIYV